MNNTGFYCNEQGLAHRLDGPAIIHFDGQKEWWVNGQRHRIDGPALCVNGNKYWYRKGRLHRKDGPAIENEDGAKEWYINGERHRADGPAIEYNDGTKEWIQNGKWHRLDGPAVEYPDGARAWYVNDKCHREDGPAVELPDGTKQWWLDNKEYTEEEYKEKIFLKFFNKIVSQETGKVSANGNKQWRNSDGLLHRIDGPAVEWGNGDKSWYQNGKLHREDGPAIECANGYKAWWINDQPHREDGPAVICPGRTKEYWLDGIAVSKNEVLKLNKKLFEENDVIQKNNNAKEWRKNGKLHREDGPALIWEDGEKEWYLNDKWIKTEYLVDGKIQVDVNPEVDSSVVDSFSNKKH